MYHKEWLRFTVRFTRPDLNVTIGGRWYTIGRKFYSRHVLPLPTVSPWTLDKFPKLLSFVNKHKNIIINVVRINNPAIRGTKSVTFSFPMSSRKFFKFPTMFWRDLLSNEPSTLKIFLWCSSITPNDINLNYL